LVFWDFASLAKHLVALKNEWTQILLVIAKVLYNFQKRKQIKTLVKHSKILEYGLTLPILHYTKQSIYETKDRFLREAFSHI
jgi:hypothetical protein